jgi:hypothetical protein
MTRTRKVTAVMLLHNKEGKVVARAQATFLVIQHHHWWEVLS